MSWDLDYTRAWKDLYWPAYKCLSWDMREQFRRVADECRDLHQDRNTNMIWPGEGSHHLHDYTLPLKADFQQCDINNLAWASLVIHFLGHFFPYSGSDPLGVRVMFLEDADHISDGFWEVVSQKKFGGATRKFSLYADMILTENLGLPETTASRHAPAYEYYVDNGWLMLRHNHNGGWENHQLGFATTTQLQRAKDAVANVHPDSLHEAVEKIRNKAMEGMDGWQQDAFELKPKFYTHKEGTSTDDEEVEWLYKPMLNGSFITRGIHHVNHKPHPFVIGPRHLANSDSMYLDPDSAPCAYAEKGMMRNTCQLSYKEHTASKVLFLECSKDVLEEEATKLIKRLPLQDDGIDGIAFVESTHGYKIVKAAGG